VREWTKTEVIRPNVELDEWIFMPNHMHAILAITEKIDSRPPAETPRHPEPTSFQPVETPRRGVSTNPLSAAERGIALCSDEGLCCAAGAG